MLAKERKPQAHSPSPRSIKHCNQRFYLNVERRTSILRATRGKSPTFSQQFRPKGRPKQKAEQERKKAKAPPPHTAISPKGKAKAKSGARNRSASKSPTSPHSNFAQREGQNKKRSKKQKRKQKPHLPTQRFRPKGEERRASQRKNPVLSFKAKSGEAEHGEKKRRLFERSEFLRFRRAKPRSRLETADGGFSFCYLFLFAAKKKK